MPIPEDNLFYGLAEKMTEEQREYVNGIIDHNLVFSNSMAGTGKTTLAFAALFYLYQKGDIDGILYLVSPVEEDKMGYRPGSQNMKEMDYADPLIDAIITVGLQPEKVMHEEYGFVKMRSHTFLRGSNKDRLGIIVDEAQNYTRRELKKTLTRFHDTCHGVIIGHSGQIDLKNPSKSGFVPYLEHYAKLKGRVKVVNLTKNFRGWISTHADLLEE